MTDNYYKEKLSADRLKRCYEVAPERIIRYLTAEIDYICVGTGSTDRVLELGCGYGRVLPPLCERAAQVVGIDNSRGSIMMARSLCDEYDNLDLVCCDALHLPFADHSFDRVFCIQNGMSAFHVEPRLLIAEALRVTRPGGMALFSSYSDKVWDSRVEWFRIQAAEGLLGEIDEDQLRHGRIVCKDGFTARTITLVEFREYASDLNIDIRLTEIDESSVFCEIVAP